MVETTDTSQSRSASYSEKLRDPRWQTRQREVIARFSNRCHKCKSPDDLEVHHTFYEYGLEPWEYDDEFLICLCAACHLRELDHWNAKKRLIKEISRHNIPAKTISSLVDALDQSSPIFGTPEKFMRVYTYMLDNPGFGDWLYDHMMTHWNSQPSVIAGRQ